MGGKGIFASCFDQMIPTEVQKERMLRGILQRQPEALARRKSSAGRIAALSAAALLVLATATAAAAVGFGWHTGLLRYLSPTESQLSSLENAVDFPEATVTENGVTISVLQTLADPYGIYVLYEVTAPEGFVFTEDVWQHASLFVEVDDSESEIAAGCVGVEVLEDHGNRRTALYRESMSRPYLQGKVEMTFGEFIKMEKGPIDPEKPYEPEVLLPGDWRLEWEFRYEDTSRTVEPNIPISIRGSVNTVTKIVVSPMGVYLFVEGDDILEKARPVIQFQNGEELAYDSDSPNNDFVYLLRDEAAQIYENDLFYRFDRVIDPQEVVSVRLGDTVIPLS